MRYLVLILFVSLPAYAQVYKCKTSNGIVYSDVPCNGAKEVTVVTTTKPSSDAEENAQRIRGETEAFNQKEQAADAVNSARSSGKCKFSYYALNDSEGKRLADSAKQECLNNEALKAKGLPTNNDAYNQWQGHKQLSTNQRNNAINNAINQNNNNNTQNKLNDIGNKLDTIEHRQKYGY